MKKRFISKLPEESMEWREIKISGKKCFTFDEKPL